MMKESRTRVAAAGSVKSAPQPTRKAAAKIDRTSIEELIYRSCLLLDEKDFSGYLDLCDEDFRYVIGAYSPEIRKMMVWQEQDKVGMKHIFDILPKHNSDHSTLSRHAMVYTVDISPDKKTAKVVSMLSVYKTILDGGVTQLFGIGKMYDTVSLKGDKPCLLARDIKLDTRMLGTGSHIPF